MLTVLQGQQTVVRPRITGISYVGYYVSDLPKAIFFWHDLLGYDESYSLTKKDSQEIRLAFIKLNDHQHIELLNEPPDHPPNMMSHLCFSVDDIEQMRAYLRSNSYEVKPGTGKTPTGDYAFEIKDPNGMTIEFAQSLPTGMERQAAGKFLPETRISPGIYHAGYMVGDAHKTTDFYKMLGFTETWRGGGNPNELSWINMKVPDGDDYVELMLYSQLPEGPGSYGGKNHLSLVTPDIDKAVATLEARPAYQVYKQSAAPVVIKTGVNGKRQVNFYDPDGTRVEIMEPRTVDGKPRPSSTAPPPPVQLSAEQDHQRVLDQLHITSLRPAADHDAASPNAVNYDEAKANPYPKLPNPLVLNNGKHVTSAKVWWTQRRPQIVEAFDRDVYGRVPAHVPKVTWQVVSTRNETEGGIPVVKKVLLGHVDNAIDPAITVNIELNLTTPAHAAGSVPVMMEISFEGYPGSKPPALPELGWRQLVLAKGWGYAILHPTSFQPDNAAGLTEGIIGLVDHGQPRSHTDEWGTIRAWAWGASRALDYLQTDKAVDARQVGIEGHSRFGKTALVAMAYDPRFAIAYISSSGTGGAKLWRRDFGERLENLAAAREYHWMDENFLKYAGPLTPGDLPVDAHELIALCAPRPVFLGAGALQGDGWADANGSFMAAVAAGPVYELLGRKGLGTSALPPIGTPLISGDIAFRQHTEGHTPAPNWTAFLEFAGRYLHGLPSR
jgi:catechol 2,3-dioxygenase-like lactoylglutathione lyase family enzyme